MARTNTIEIIINAKNNTGKDITKVGKDLSALGDKMSGIGNKLTLGVTAPLAGIGVAAINAASDLNESMSKTEVVFGNAADSVKNFADTAAQNLGISEQAALEAAGTYGNLLRAMGLTENASADMSTGLVQLASDLASFNNLDPTDVLDKLRAGLTGETEPLKSLGVNMNQARIEAKALELGLVGVDEELTAAAKAQAAYAIIMEDTTLAQGDFARTSDGLANSTRIMKAQFTDAAAALGQSLLPFATQAAQSLTELITSFNNLSPSTQSAIVSIGAVVAAIGPVLSIGGKVISVISALSGVFSALGQVLAVIGGALAAISAPVWLLIAAIGALIATIVIFGQDALNTINMIGQIIGAVFQRAAFEIGQFFASLVAKFNEARNTVNQAMQAIAQFIVNAFIKAGQAVVGFVQKGITALNNFKNTVINVFNRAKAAIDNFISRIKDLIAKLASLVLPEAFNPGSPTPFEIGLRGIGEAMDQLATKSLPNLSGGMGTLSPAIAPAGAARTAMTTAPGMTGSGPVSLSVTFAPALSMGDRSEAETQVVPLIEQLLRRAKRRGAL